MAVDTPRRNMVNRLLVWAFGSPRLQRQVTRGARVVVGVRRGLQQELANSGYRVRVYIPHPYLTRRMAERPANLLFFQRALASR
jgi:proline dehydrogenase